MLDFIFRRGNPSNSWHRSTSLSLAAKLDLPSLNGVDLGAELALLSALGRSDELQSDTLSYFDLGVTVDYGKQARLQGFAIIFADEDNQYQPFGGTVSWKGKTIDFQNLNEDSVEGILGPAFWRDTDEAETISFYEFPGYEIQIELSLDGLIKRVIVTEDALMASPEQRAAYKVDKPWPPEVLASRNL